MRWHRSPARTPRHHPSADQFASRRRALAWLASQLAWERTLEHLRSPGARSAPKAA